MNFILQVQRSSCVQETLWSTDETSSEATKRNEVWYEDTWSFSGVIHGEEVLCEVH